MANNPENKPSEDDIEEMLLELAPNSIGDEMKLISTPLTTKVTKLNTLWFEEAHQNFQATVPFMDQLVDVRPLTNPSGQIFYVDFAYRPRN